MQGWPGLGGLPSYLFVFLSELTDGYIGVSSNVNGVQDGTLAVLAIGPRAATSVQRRIPALALTNSKK